VVGGALVQLLTEYAEELAAGRGLHFELVRVLVQDPDRPRPVELDPALLTTDLDLFLATEADLVVELLGGLEPAGKIARTTLAAGRRLVTANKALLAEHGAELAALARRYGGTLDFEGAVGGGVPLIRVLRESLPGTGIRSVQAILNGTSNYILTRLEEGTSYDDALVDAQRAGFAEADPSRDLDGRDAADKLRILAWLAFGVEPDLVRLRPRGILPNPDRLASAAAAYGMVVRLVAECAVVGAGVTATVEPVAVRPDSELGRTRDENNIVLVDSSWNGRIHLAGPGAGGAPTASAVLTDMLRAAQPLTAPAREPGNGIDPRTHHWIVGGDVVRERIDLLRKHLESGGIRVGEERSAVDGSIWLRTGPCTGEKINRILAIFETTGAAPLLLRSAAEPGAGKGDG
jgi:homoserine dehydrogenase